ncbi:phosphoribosyltransferase [Thermovenabulum gondwanense]|uniref:Putative phosphoribosyl transferase n=1 Tax=Thermovenabulum gondwanense TaxID=520767 RepID=A0A162M699_9FIRM|nr:phosphoribosyltransferase family protein [Thermovenabulum gondwanense]KYO64295.1 putative phosphoribosyl transferase [Thermovenabulum gondwanense]
MLKDRIDAGKRLAKLLSHYKKDEKAVIFAIPRGGVVVGGVLAEELSLPLDVVVTKKIGAPFNEEFAVGAVAPDGTLFVYEEAVNRYGIKRPYLENEAKLKLEKIKENLIKFRGQEYYDSLEGKKVILVDDGIATGFTVKAAVEFLKKLKAEKIIIAVPVIAPDSVKEFKGICHELYYIYSEEPFYAVGQFYEDFSQVEDEEVINILKNTEKR